MLKVATLFALLATLAHAKWKEGYAPEENAPCYVDGQDGTIQGALCVVKGLNLGKRLLGGGLLNGLGHAKHDDRYRWREGDRCDVGGQYGTIKDTLCIIADINVKRDNGHQYGFGWFHPGPYANGDRCWTGTQEGYIQDSTCVAVTIGGGSYFNNGWFAQPYYGYGHNFGWYHPGPFIEGDRCTQGGREGLVRDALCIDLGLNLGLGDLGLGGLGLAKRWNNNPEYWYEPYFGPEYNFGWFHEGPFSEGDRCWTGGKYGSIANSLCVIADLDIEVKRDLLGGLGGLGGLLGNKYDHRTGDRCFKHNTWGMWNGNDCDTTLDLDIILHSRSLFGNGDKCWYQGHWGAWKDNSCDISVDVNAIVDFVKRDVPFAGMFRDDPWLGRGVPCTKDGRHGILRDTICIVANVDLNVKRDEDAAPVEDVNVAEVPAPEEDPAETAEDIVDEAPTDGVTSGWEYDGDYDQYMTESTEGIDGENMEKRLLSYSAGDNADHAVAKTVHGLLSDIKTRGLLTGSQAGRPSRWGTGAPSKNLLGGLGLDKLLGKRELLGSEGFRIEDLVKTLGAEKRDAVVKRQIGSMGQNDLLGGVWGGKAASQNGGANPLAGALGGLGGSNNMVGGLLGGQKQGGGLLAGLL